MRASRFFSCWKDRIPAIERYRTVQEFASDRLRPMSSAAAFGLAQLFQQPAE